MLYLHFYSNLPLRLLLSTAGEFLTCTPSTWDLKYFPCLRRLGTWLHYPKDQGGGVKCMILMYTNDFCNIFQPFFLKVYQATFEFKQVPKFLSCWKLIGRLVHYLSAIAFILVYSVLAMHDLYYISDISNHSFAVWVCYLWTSLTL